MELEARLELKKKKELGWELKKVFQEKLEQTDHDWNKRKGKEQEEKARQPYLLCRKNFTRNQIRLTARRATNTTGKGTKKRTNT